MYNSIIFFKVDRNLNSKEIALKTKNFIDKYAQADFFLNINKYLNNIFDVPTKIISFEIKQILIRNFIFSKGVFKNNFKFYHIFFDCIIFFFLIFFSLLFKSKVTQKKFNIIFDEIEFESHDFLYKQFCKLFTTSVFLTKNKKIRRNAIYEWDLICNYDSLANKRFKLLLIFIRLLFYSFRYRVNFFLIYNSILFKFIKYESIFKQIISKFLFQYRFYTTSAIKNYIFKKNGGTLTCCIQKNICEFSISYFINIDIFFTLGKKTAKFVNKLGSSIKFIVPVGSLFMETRWHRAHKDLSRVPLSDILVIGLNYAHAFDRMFIDKIHYDNYYKFIYWIKKISIEFPNLNIIVKHHDNYIGDEKEKEILKDSDVKLIYNSKSINKTYAYAFKSKLIISFGSTMILETLSINKNSYFIDPQLKNYSFFSSIGNSNLLRINSFNKLKKIVYQSTTFYSKFNFIKQKDFFCYNSQEVSKKIFKYLKNL